LAIKRIKIKEIKKEEKSFSSERTGPTTGDRSLL